MRTRHKAPEVGKEPPEAAFEGQIVEGQVDEGEQLVISVQHDVNDPNTIVLVPVVYNGEEMMGDENEGMVAIRMIDDDDEDGPHQVMQVVSESATSATHIINSDDVNIPTGNEGLDSTGNDGIEEHSKEDETGQLEDDDELMDQNQNSDEAPAKKTRKKRSKSSFVCHYCGYKAQSNPALRNHVLAVHEKLKPFLCDICGYASSAKANLDMHKAIKHADKKNVLYSCEDCEYKCSNDQHLKAHVQIVHVENQTPFECGICQYQCRKRCLVVKHMKIVHEKSKPFACTQCPRAFSANCILLRHIEMVHEKVRPFACDVCGYAFAERRFLLKHVRAVHEKAKPFACKKCDYRCAMRDSLVRHNYNKHERREKFRCRLCNTGFRKRSDMEEHYKAEHETPFKPYPCEDCSYATDKKPRLEKHILMEHTKGEHNKYRNLRCKECNKVFTQHTQLAEHCRTVHGNAIKAYVCDGSNVEQGRPRKRGRQPAKPREEYSDEDMEEFEDENDPEWKRLGNSSPVIRTSSSRRVRRPKTFDDYVTPFLKREPVSEDDIAAADESEAVSQEPIPPPDKKAKEEITDFIESNIVSGTVQDNDDDDGIDFPDTVVDDFDDDDDEEEEDDDDDDDDDLLGDFSQLHDFSRDDSGSVARSKPQNGPRSIKFTVRTKGQSDDKPIELEIEIKDQGFSGFYGSIEDRLQNDAQTVVNFLSDGAVVDAIMSIERKSSRMVDDDEDDDSNIKKIDFTNPPIVSNNRKGKRLHGGRRTFLCDMCGYGCTSRQTLNTHYAYKHGNLKPEAMECDECDYRCDLITQLNSHKQIVHKDGEIPFACNLCPQQYKTEGDLDRHLRAIHLDERPFVCSFCKHGFNKKSNLVKHIRMVHERIRPHQCEQCEWNFGERRDLLSHIDAVHKKIKPFQCDQCDFKCARPTQLRVHLSNVHRTKPSYECETCGHRFVNRAYLKSHVKSVHEVEVKRYQCGYCEYSSVTKLSVDRHMTTHTKEKRSGALAPLFCSFCGDTFPNHSKLSKHVKMEHGATAAIPKKVYECSSCDYKAGTHSLLKAHVRSVHENERRFKCELCDFTSFAKSAMKRHISAIHEKFKPFSCDSCDFRTSYKESLDLHLATVHKTGDLPKRVITRRLKKQGHSLLGDTLDHLVEVDNMLEPLDDGEVAVADDDTVEVSVPLVTDDGVTMHLGEVTVIEAAPDDQVHEIQL